MDTRTETRGATALADPAKLMLSLKGHTAEIIALAFSPDRCLLASASGDGSVRVWDISRSKPGERPVLRKPGERFHSLAFAPNSRTLAVGSGSLNGFVWLYDVTDCTPAETGTLRGARGSIDALSFSADGKFVAGAGEDRTMRVWEPVRSGATEARSLLLGHTQPVRAVAFAPDGSGAATAARDATVRLWTLSRIRSTERAVLSHGGEVTAVAYASDGKTLATAGHDGTIRLWDLTAIKPTVRAELKGHAGAVRAVLIAADGIASAGDDLRVRNWDARTGKQVREWEVPGRAATRVAFTPDGRYLAKGAADGAVELFRVAEKRGRLIFDGARECCKMPACDTRVPLEAPPVAKDPLDPSRCAKLLSALAAPERLKIVRFLTDGTQNVTAIADMLGLKGKNVVNVSHHLSVLRHAGLIRGKKSGRFVLYSLRPGVLEDAVEAGVPKDALNLGCCRIEMPNCRIEGKE